jgi:hypothetical protein
MTNIAEALFHGCWQHADNLRVWQSNLKHKYYYDETISLNISQMRQPLDPGYAY